MSPASGVVGVGIDAVDVDRFRATLARRPGVGRRAFREGEHTALAARRDPTLGLAARWAAKEAVMKALGVGLGAVSLHDIEVVGGPGGRPTVELHGRAAERARTLGVAEVHLSMTHTATSAQAVAVATGSP